MRQARRIFQVQDPPLHRNIPFAIQPPAPYMITSQVDAAFSDAKVPTPIARAVIDMPPDTMFDYRCGQPVLPGRLVVVPFGSRCVMGLAVETAATTDVP